jgi:hypothetical protein
MVLCPKCGKENSDNRKYCKDCGSYISALDKQSDRASLEPAKRSQSSMVSDSLAGTFCLIGGGLVAIGSFLPYAVAVTMFGTSLSRNAYQFGQNLSMTYDGPLILAAGLLLVFRGLGLRGVLSWSEPGAWTPLWVSIVAAAIVLSSWLSTFPSSTAVTYNRGYGGIVSLVGVLCGFVAVYVRRRGA